VGVHYSRHHAIVHHANDQVAHFTIGWLCYIFYDAVGVEKDSNSVVKVDLVLCLVAHCLRWIPFELHFHVSALILLDTRRDVNVELFLCQPGT
jgi:hypothetical protein